MDSDIKPSNHFPTTRWTLVAQAAGRGSGATAIQQKALEELCQTYWPPIFAFIRSRGATKEEAEDLTQGFFADFLRKADIAKPSEKRGKLRTFLLTSARNYMTTDWRKRQRDKRGGEVDFISFDLLTERGILEPQENLTPEKLFLRQWTLTVLKRVLTTLRRRYQREGKEAIFEALQFVISSGRDEKSYAEIAKQLKTSEPAVRTAAHRLRRRYAAMLSAEIAETLLEGDDVEEERRKLMNSFS